MRKYYLLIILLWIGVFIQISAQPPVNQLSVPFSTDSTHLTIFNGEEYVPIFLKGINFGVSVPGRFPGELHVSKSQYVRWITQIKDAGFNCIRLYTLHFPHFYEVLDSINTANPEHPVFIFQGVWLDEEPEGYTRDLYYLTDIFKEEISTNIHAMHGNIFVPVRFGKAYGYFDYDVSKWVLGYILGREIAPDEIRNTNQNHTEDTTYKGEFISLSSGDPAEVWIADKLDYALAIEGLNYQTQRPLSISSWPTLDPIVHTNVLHIDEDTESLDLSNLDLSNCKAGYFASYHAYPYYPDFVSHDSLYLEYEDAFGQNSYVGYLTDLKSRYPHFPLIIAEFGVPSSWGIAHYAQSGMNHGGSDEQEQGIYLMRMLENFRTTGLGGGMAFAWMDEWFKRTWVTDPFDFNPQSRILWHNVTAAEQNFGLIGFEKPSIDSLTYTFGRDEPIPAIKYGSDYAFFYLDLFLKNPLDLTDTLWIALDTYDSIRGEHILPTGDTLINGAEFSLRITNYSAELFVAEAYDLFGIWHGMQEPFQKYQSTSTYGKPWKIVRWKNNEPQNEVQYIGNLKTNRSDLPRSSRDAVTISDTLINIRLPWSLLQFTDPSKLKVFHDDLNTAVNEDTISEGIHVAVLHNNRITSPNYRYSWEPWENPLAYKAYTKKSYKIVKEGLSFYNTPAIAMKDTFFIADYASHYPVLENDYDMDGNSFEPILWELPGHGSVVFDAQGSFQYFMDENNSSLADSFTYVLFDGHSLSTPAKVNLSISSLLRGTDEEIFLSDKKLNIYPNPVEDMLYIESENQMDDFYVFNSQGTLLFKDSNIRNHQIEFDMIDFPSGTYFILISTGNRKISKKVVKLP